MKLDAQTFGDAQNYNLAYNKKVVMSSTSGPFIGDSCVDGFLRTFCHTNRESRPYLWIDLGKSYDIRRIDIFNRNGYGKVYFNKQ